jgi:hypothetical protein
MKMPSELHPNALDGKAGNQLATVRARVISAILRFYGPTEAALDKSRSGHDDGNEPDQLRQPRTALRYLYQSG